MTEFPDWLAELMEERAREREQATVDALGRFTEREQRIIREAAVMGFVRGTFFPCDGPPERFPRDSEIVHMTMQGALTAPRQHFRVLRSGQYPPPPLDPEDV